MIWRVTCRKLSVLVVFSCLVATNLAAQPVVTRVMSGLDNPRGLAIGPEGVLYVVEAGRGGAGPCTVLRGSMQCFGATGAVTRLGPDGMERWLTGLPSYISAAGEVTGPHDLSFVYRGGAYLVIGLGHGGGDPEAARRSFGAGGAMFGLLLWVSSTGTTQVVADVAAHVFATNPAGTTDSNPFAVFADRGGLVVADAGANALLRIDNRSRVSTLAAFPSRPTRATDAAPTSVAVGADGAYYVSELSGVPFAAGAARIYRVAPAGGSAQIFAERFTTIIDLAFGADDSLYVLEHSTGPVFFAGPGDIIRIMPDGSRSVVFAGLDRPTSLVVDRDGTIYVTNHGISAGTGEVLKIRP